ncbi:uncharacterized protein BX663DRAFT_488410 [Cokeromyces recurvatus]|uniref:uncharacterized protein n=1 Tax=Cokeromyces recurvatus TaxID=90255 RepID=UPI00221E6E75|nr:uncharacterized protein BX663DRAFT_488410 [Cokeromyces recurvatus]KAI7900493.1 hypothetical protein BX663DRAFT_488410 [Cokeromyces recurvatus]
MDDDQEICRVCRSESTPDHPLYHPCKCSGSIRFVHEDCLIEWLSHSKKKYCELCEHPFTFSPIYRDDMPEKVPLHVLFSQLVNRLTALLKTCLRGLTVITVWLIMLPNFTLWTWRFYFWSGENIGFNTHVSNLLFNSNETNTILDVNTNNTTSISTNDNLGSQSFLVQTLKNFLSDCVEGQIITAFVIIIFVAAYLFREWVLQNLPAEQPNLQLNDEDFNINQNNNNNNQQLLQEQEAIDTLLNAMQVINPTTDNGMHHGHLDPTQRQLNHLRVELENEMAELNNDENHYQQRQQPSEWSSSLDNRIHQDDEQLFGGMDGNNQDVASSSAEMDTENRSSSSRTISKPTLDSIHDDDKDYFIHNDTENKEEEQEEDWSNNNNNNGVDDDEMDEQWENDDDDDEDSLPDLIDNDHRRLNNDTIRRILQDHLAGNANLHMNQPAERQRDMVAALERELLQNRPRQQQPQPRDPPVAVGAAAAAADDDNEPLDVGDDINGVLEAIGMRGNPWMLVQNSVLMSLMISLCLGIAVWIPYVVGRLIILVRPITFIETPIYMMRLITDPLVDFALDHMFPFIWSYIQDFIQLIMPKKIQVALQTTQKQMIQMMESSILLTSSESNQPINMTLDSVHDENRIVNMDWSIIQQKIEELSLTALKRWHQFAIGQTGLDRSVCVIVGYLVLIGLGSWYLTHGRNRAHLRRRPAVRTTAEKIQEIIHQQGIFLKVLFFILIELVVFPTVCGFLLDMSTLPLFANATIGSRYAFHTRSPYSSYFLHWFLGTGVLFYFAIFITVCREIIRPGVMWFIRDPNDPQFHPVQEMVERPLPNLLHKISQSALIYSVILVFGVGTVTYTLAYTRLIFPLSLPFNAPLSTLAIDLLIIQFLLPPLFNFIKPRDYSKRALDIWWHFASRQLRLTSFMFNERRPEEEGHHVRRSVKAWLTMAKAEIPTDEFSEVAIHDDDDSLQQDVIFRRDGMMVRVPKYDSVPVDPKRRMIVPVDPVTFEAIDEEERRRGHPAAADTVDESQATIVVYIPPYFKQRVIIFLLYMWFSISVFACSVTVLPLLIGRTLFKLYLAPESSVNDFYSFALGIYIMVGIILVIRWISVWYTMINSHQSNQNEIMTFIKEKTSKAGKFIYLSSMFGLVIPLLIGIAVDLFVFMPIRSINPESSDLVIDITQNWSFGVAYMSIIHNIIHVLPANNRLRRKLNEIIGEGIMQADLWTLTRTIIIPVILSALLAITIPGIISWSILQTLDSNMKNDPFTRITITRYTYPIVFGLFVFVLIGLALKKLFNIWTETVRDDTYLIGKRLHNLQTHHGPASTIDNAAN